MSNRGLGGSVAVALLAMAVLVTGCSGAFEGKKIDYKSAKKLPPLEVPPDLASPGTPGRYVVPEASGSATYSEYEQQRSGKAQPVAPEKSPVLPVSDRARVVRAGSQRWMVVKSTPEQLWPQIRDFWQENGFLVSVEDPAAGLIETDWAENRAKIQVGGITGFINRSMDVLVSLPERDKFRTRLERGVEPGTTEVYVSHKGMAEVYYRERDNNTKWQVRPSDPELEAVMLARLAEKVAGLDIARAQVLVKSADQQKPAASLSRSTTSTVAASTLRLEDGFDRAWRRVGLALDRVGFMVEDRNRADGLYFVRYQDPDAALGKKSGLSRLAFWRSDDAGKAGPEQYRVRVAAAAGGTGSEVTVLNRDGVADDSATAKRILGLLVEQLR
jgi:outer membrane protein assembly factor BamC